MAGGSINGVGGRVVEQLTGLSRAVSLGSCLAGNSGETEKAARILLEGISVGVASGD